MTATVYLISKGINISKKCNNITEIEKFKRDMPAKYNLLFSNTPYAIRISYQ